MAEIMDIDINDEIINDLKHMSLRMRKNALDMALEAGSSASHFGAGLSIIDILSVLYGKIMNFNCKNTLDENRDRFILSKGHGVLGYYAALAETGCLSYEELLTFEKSNTFLAGHPVINRKKGIEFTNGSLGMGLSLGIGVAISGKLKKKNFRTYVLLGDGECNEGSVWEAAMSASQFNLGNLTAIIDKNSFQLGGTNSEIMNIGNIALAFSSFGWRIVEADGHSHKELLCILSDKGKYEKPLLIVANTIKGKGFSFSENNNTWHHSVLTKAQYEIAISELEVLLNEIRY